ncbi:hypothetical protein HanIR_Chr11g0519001 [Helianthus annuus]|nr:hypothetical protein HanIR_Chr11g0519001 [Helianthus annuus]
MGTSLRTKKINNSWSLVSYSTTHTKHIEFGYTNSSKTLLFIDIVHV